MRATLRVLILALLTLAPYQVASAQSPALAPIVDLTVNAGDSLVVDVVAIDVAEREVTVLSSLPNFGALNSPRAAVGELVTSFTLRPTPLESGSYLAAISAIAGGLTTFEFFLVQVNPAGSPAAPVLDAPPLWKVEAGSDVQFSVDVADPDGAGIASLVASSLPPGASFVADSVNSSATFSWTPDFADVGEYDVVFSASALNGFSGGAVTHIRVQGPSVENGPPVLVVEPAVTVAAGSSLEFTVVATDPDEDPIQLSAGVLPSSASFVDEQDGTGTFTWTPTAAQAGDHEVVFSGDDGRGGVGTATTMIAVVGAAVDNCPRGLGFWKSQVAQRRNGSTKFDAAQMDQIAARIDAVSDLFDWDGALDGFRAIVDPPRPMDIRKQTVRMYAVLLANVCTGELGYVTYQGQVVGLDPATEIEGPCLDEVSTISDLMAAAEWQLAELEGETIRSQTTSAYEQLKKCIETVNDGIGIGPTCPSDAEGAFRATGDFLNSSVHPNPLNPSTEISFLLSREGRVRVAVYDLQGRLVKDLMDERLAPGEQRVQWDGSNTRNVTVSSGVYFVRIQTPEGEVTRRATLVK